MFIIFIFIDSVPNPNQHKLLATKKTEEEPSRSDNQWSDGDEDDEMDAGDLQEEQEATVMTTPQRTAIPSGRLPTSSNNVGNHNPLTPSQNKLSNKVRSNAANIFGAKIYTSLILIPLVFLLS